MLRLLIRCIVHLSTPTVYRGRVSKVDCQVVYEIQGKPSQSCLSVEVRGGGRAGAQGVATQRVGGFHSMVASLWDAYKGGGSVESVKRKTGPRAESGRTQMWR